MTTTDAYGLEMTTSGSDDQRLFDSMLAGYLYFEADLVDRMGAVAAVGDDAAPMARVLHAQLMAMSHTAAGVSLAGDVAAALSNVGLTHREELHVAALDAVARGDVDTATAAWGAVLDAWPHDMMALRLQHFALFNRGDLDQMARRAQQAAAAWDAASAITDRPLIDGMICFALEEQGRYEDAEWHGRVAVSAQPDDLWGIHAIAHVLEMTGRAEEGREWVTGHGDTLHGHGSFAGHIWWHLALYLLETGDHPAAMRLFDTEVFSPGAVEGLTLTNAIALLARAEWAGHDVGDRWTLLVDGAAMRIGHHSHPFNDCHYAYALARAGEADRAGSLVDSMRTWADSHADTASEVMTGAGLAIAEGMLNLAEGRHEAAHDLLSRTAGDRWRIGGSHAQRDLFAQAELVAAIAAGRSAAARQLADARLAAKPESPRNHVWQAAADPDRHDVAMSRARSLGWIAA